MYFDKVCIKLIIIIFPPLSPLILVHCLTFICFVYFALNVFESVLRQRKSLNDGKLIMANRALIHIHAHTHPYAHIYI